VTIPDNPQDASPADGTAVDDDALWALFSDSRNSMLLADDDRRYVNANTAALVLLGYDLPTLRTMRIDDVSLPEYRPFLDDVWNDFLEKGGSIGQFPILRSDGTAVNVHFNATANVRPGLHLSLFINPMVSGEGGDLDTDSQKDSLQEPVEAVRARTGDLLDEDERTVITLLALGLSWHEVAEETGMPVARVRELMESAMTKLGARTRAHAVSIAIRAGEIDPGDPRLR